MQNFCSFSCYLSQTLGSTVITLADVHLNCLNWFLFLILAVGPLLILIVCMIFVSPFYKDAYINRLFSREARLWKFVCYRKLFFKGATKSYFTHCFCVVIVLFNTAFCKPAFSTVFFRKLVFHLYIKLICYKQQTIYRSSTVLCKNRLSEMV